MLYSNMSFHSCIDSKRTYVTFSDDEITTCPLCHKLLTPKALIGCVYSHNDNGLLKKYASALYVCTGCESPFMHTFEIEKVSSSSTESYYKKINFIECVPVKYTEQVFEKEIISLSPAFVKIYNQALAAETFGLDEIAGLGYRKALEFIIKDFAIHTHPGAEDKIKSMPLSSCITQYIDAPNIKTLATRSAWIGNDEAHYVRKQEDRDVNDMKSFIRATVLFISMILITEDAASMEPK